MRLHNLDDRLNFDQGNINKNFYHNQKEHLQISFHIESSPCHKQFSHFSKLTFFAIHIEVARCFSDYKYLQRRRHVPNLMLFAQNVLRIQQIMCCISLFCPVTYLYGMSYIDVLGGNFVI